MKTSIILLLAVITLFGCDENKSPGKKAEENQRESITASVEQLQAAPEERTIAETIATLNAPGVRLRDLPNLECETVKLLGEGEKVTIEGKSEEKQKIGDMESLWIKVRTEENYSGWVYGYFLDTEQEKESLDPLKITEDYISRTMNKDTLKKLAYSINYNLDREIPQSGGDIPEMANELDRDAYPRLAGVYITSEPVLPNTLSAVVEREYSWGKDFDYGFMDTYYVDYQDGKWGVGGGGEIQYFTIDSIQQDSITIIQEYSNPKIKTLKLTNDYFQMAGYKVGGPQEPMKYYKEIVNFQKEEFKKYNLLSPEEAEAIIGNKPFQVYMYLKEGELENLNTLLSEEQGLTMGYRFDNVFSKVDATSQSADFTRAISEITDMLNDKYCPNYYESIPLYNAYAVSSLTIFQEKFPGAIVVELFHDDIEYITMAFVKEGDSWKLACILNNALFLA